MAVNIFYTIFIFIPLITLLKQVESLDLTNGFIDLTKNFVTYNQSQECTRLFDDFPWPERLPRWVIQMFDSTGKLQSGLLAGNVMNLGDFDQCVKIHDEAKGIRGKYCLASTHFHFGGIVNMSSIVGICIPNVCQLGNFARMPDIGFKLRFDEDLCQIEGDADKLDAGDICCIVLVIFLVLIVFFASLYDYTQRKQGFIGSSRSIIAFSAYTNTINLKTINPDNELSCLHGIRVISMLWIMYGSRALISVQIPAVNSYELTDIIYSDESNHIHAAFCAIDTFFYLSGFMLAYNTLQPGKQMQLVDCLRSISLRFLRIIPSTAALFLFIVTLPRRIGSGPIYKLGVENARRTCLDHWLSYFLFYQNYDNHNNLCLPQTWFLSADMQMHLFLTPLIVFPLGKLLQAERKWGIFISFCVLMILGEIIPVVVFIVTGDNSNIFATHWHLAIFAIGIFAGAIAGHVKKYIKNMNKAIFLIIWIVMMAVMIATAFPERYTLQEPNSWLALIARTIGRLGWGIALTWIIFSCISGQSETINDFLSFPIFEVMSRLTFAMYLINYLEIGYHALLARNSIYVDYMYLFQTWISDIFLTMFFAYIWTILIELPMIQLGKIIFGAHKKLDISTN